jgi:hypothetical protein
MEVGFCDMTLLNFIKIYQLFQKLLVGNIQLDRQTGDLISLPFIFKKSRVQMCAWYLDKYYFHIQLIIAQTNLSPPLKNILVIIYTHTHKSIFLEVETDLSVWFNYHPRMLKYSL